MQKKTVFGLGSRTRNPRPSKRMKHVREEHEGEEGPGRAVSTSPYFVFQLSFSLLSVCTISLSFSIKPKQE